MPEVREVNRPTIWGPIITVCIVTIVIIWCCWWWWWRCYPCQPVTPAPVAMDCVEHCVVTGDDCTPSEWELSVYAGDIVLWANVRTDTLEIDFGTASPFNIAVDPADGHYKLVIPPYEVLVVEVKDDVATGAEFPYLRSCAPGAGGPKVKVGG